MSDAYHVPPEEQSWDFSVLMGPNDFECVLGEPEDRTWNRDGASVVKELNRLHEENQRLVGKLAKVEYQMRHFLKSDSPEVEDRHLKHWIETLSGRNKT